MYMCAASCRAQDMTESKIKAIYVYNFISFTAWPNAVNEKLTLCIYGSDPINEHLQKFNGKQIGSRHLSVHIISSTDGIEECQIIFIARTMIGNVARVMDKVRGKPVLSIADSHGALRYGVNVNLLTEHDSVVFEVNLLNVREQGLAMSSKLLRLAKEVRQ